MENPQNDAKLNLEVKNFNEVIAENKQPENLEEENLVDETFPENDGRRWIKLVESESKDVVKEYYSNLGLSDAMLARKENILDVGSSMSDFAAYCKLQGISDRIISLEPVAEQHPGIIAAHEMYLGEEMSEYVQSKTVRGVMEKLPFKENSFDLIVNHFAMPGHNYSLAEVEEMQKGINEAFDEIIRVLKPGGEARLFPLADGEDERWSQWRIFVDEKLAEIKKTGNCNVFVEDVINMETSEIMVGERLVLKKNMNNTYHEFGNVA